MNNHVGVVATQDAAIASTCAPPVETAGGSGTTSAGAIEDASQNTKPQAQIFVVIYRLVNR